LPILRTPAWLGEVLTALIIFIATCLFLAGAELPFPTVFACQLFSNVRFVLPAAHWVPKLADPHLGWLSLALVSTLAGNLTPVASVANLIVLELAGDKGQIPFLRFPWLGALCTFLRWRWGSPVCCSSVRTFDVKYCRLHRRRCPRGHGTLASLALRAFH
jgi:hypothetical protein